MRARGIDAVRIQLDHQLCHCMMNLKSVKQMCKKKYLKCEKGKNTKLKGMSPDMFKLHAPCFS